MEKKIFQSKYHNYRLILKPTQRTIDNLGRVTIHPGESIQFENGFFETDDPKIYEALMNSPYYGVDFWCVNPDKQKEIPKENLKKAEEEKGAEKAAPTACPYCSFKAKTLSGLKAHIRYKHKKEA